MKRLMSVLVMMLTLGILASPAMAEDFEAIVAEGMKSYSEGNYDDAIAKFLKAKLIQDEPELLYNVARAYDKKGDCTAAKNSYEKFLKRGDAPEATSIKAAEYIEALGECPTTGVLTLACTPADALVSANGNELGTCGQFELEEGSYTLIVTAEGYKPADRKVDVKAGSSEADTVILEREEQVFVDEPGPNWLGISLVSGGGALIITAVVVDIVNFSGNAKELEKYPLGDPRRTDFESSYETNQIIVGVTAGLGVALVATGAVLWALDIGGGGGNEQASADGDDLTWSVSPAVSTDGMGAALHVTF